MQGLVRSLISGIHGGLGRNISPTEMGALLHDYVEGILGDGFGHEEMNLRAKGNLLRNRHRHSRERLFENSLSPCPGPEDTCLQATHVRY